jgi:stage V sporulation protein G
MNVTEIKIFLAQEKKLKAYVTIVLDNCFVVRKLKVVCGSRGLFVSMPNERRKDGSIWDIAYPKDCNSRAHMQKLILEAYLSEIKNQASQFV